MANYRRNRVAGGACFFTIKLADRHSRLLVEHIVSLRSAGRRLRLSQPTELERGGKRMSCCRPTPCPPAKIEVDMINEKDLEPFNGSTLMSVTISAGSMTLLFSTDAQLLLQCPFDCIDSNEDKSHGHGEQPADGMLLLRFLNSTVQQVSCTQDLVLKINFDGGKSLKVIPEANGLESYVVTTDMGICPVMIF